MYLGNKALVSNAGSVSVTARSLALVLPALLGKPVVYFAENDDGEQGIVIVGREGTVAQKLPDSVPSEWRRMG
jgi:hypothetical protein